jgi:hypothetical protein
MICGRSGYCCVWCSVAIIIDGRIKMKPGGVRCPHLQFGEDGKAACAVHDKPWYEITPCFAYGNPDIDPDHVGVQRPCVYSNWTKDQVLKGSVESEKLTDVGSMTQLSDPTYFGDYEE